MPWPNELRKIVTTWWLEGEGRNLATEFVRQFYTPRQQWMNRPHMALNQTLVHPKYRGKGVDTLLKDRGTNMADELKLEGFIENMLSPLQPSGIRQRPQSLSKTLIQSSHEIVNQLGKENASGEWNRLLHELGPSKFYINYRPVGGEFEEGNPLTPWQVDQMLAKKSRSDLKCPVMKLGP
ncbi:uncharacterized protein EAF01_005701 [Botrytis porri]|uniref:uncharacterized protein n=1 Tax=Botrytis porri TaxID=87229 RepID=UPI00190243B5|nr:uncharacterized protein EAF01_005701 [Botrytis porri]KAF7905180.1 hypothetical protein EAF01_005701 [Botrytis porri]